MKPIFRPAAAADVEAAYRWYEARRPGLGQDYLGRIQSVLDLIEQNPDGFPIVHRDSRRALLRQFPYALFYRLVEGQVIVVACFHAKRDPRRWRSRR